MTNKSISTSVFKIQEFKFFDQTIRAIVDNGKILFCGKDVAVALGYSKPQNAINTHCRYSLKRGIPHPQNQKKTLNMLFVPEGDVYRLVAHSKLPKAEEFEIWIFDEVVPSVIRAASSCRIIQQDLFDASQLDAPSTTKDRKPVSDMVNTWVGLAPVSYRDAWQMLKAHLGVDKADDITLVQIQPAVEWLQEQINIHTAKPLPGSELDEYQKELLASFDKLDPHTRAATIILCAKAAGR